MKKQKIAVKLTFTERVLGTLSGNQELTKEFIISKSKDDAKIKEESEMVDAMQDLEKSTTYFPRDKDGKAFFYDYQIKGFIKEAVGVMVELGEVEISKWQFKKIVDNFIFVNPRKIYIQSNDEVFFVERPLRVDTMQGERVALARSEAFAAGTILEFEVEWLESSNVKSKARQLNEEFMIQVMDYGSLKGLGQWRNAKNGSFTYEITKAK